MNPKKESLKALIKAIGSVLLLVCLLKMPYSYYQFVRVATTAIFVYLVYTSYKQGQFVMMLICLTAVIIFNPVFILHLHKKQWQYVDLITAIILIIWLVFDLSFSKRKLPF